MKISFVSLAIALLSISASAEITRGPKYDTYVLQLETEKPVSVTVATVLETTDGCNDFGLNGEFRKLEVPVGMQTIEQEFVAKFEIMQTLKACPPLREKRKVALDSQALEIKPDSGRIYATILVPSNFKLLVK